MRLIVRKSTTFWGVGIAVAIILCLSLLVVLHGRAGALTGSGRLITIHDRGEEKVFLSDAATVGDALKQENITLDSHDVVEPAASEKLVASEYQVNIYRARPVTVIDGATREKIITAYQTADQIAKDAGISLYPEDTTTLGLSDDLVDNGAGLQLTIKRATAFNLTLYGSTSTARTQAKTVGDMLNDKGIKLGPDDRTSVPLTTLITADMSVQVWREGTQTVTVQEPIAFDTQSIQDADQNYGYKAVQTPGVNGSKNVTYSIDIRDGQEVSRTQIASITTTQPTTEVDIIGAKLPTPTNPSENEALGHTMMLNAGFGEDQWACLDTLWQHESGWRVTAGNTSSGAYGIPQALPASKMASDGADYLTAAQTQIAWGLDYIKGRYGTPCSAWSSWQIKGWY